MQPCPAAAWGDAGASWPSLEIFHDSRLFLGYVDKIADTNICPILGRQPDSEFSEWKK